MEKLPPSPNRAKKKVSSKTEKPSIRSHVSSSLRLKFEEIKRQKVDEEILWNTYTKMLNAGLSYTFRRSKKSFLRSSDDSVQIYPASDFSTPPRSTPLVEVRLDKIDGEHIIQLLHPLDRTVLMSLVPEIRTPRQADAHRIYRNGKIVARVHRICTDAEECRTGSEGSLDFGLFVSHVEYPTLTRSTSFNAPKRLRRHSSSEYGELHSEVHSNSRGLVRKSTTPSKSRLMGQLFRNWKRKKSGYLLGNGDGDDEQVSDFELDEHRVMKIETSNGSMGLQVCPKPFDRVALRTQIVYPKKFNDSPTISFYTLKPNGEKNTVIAKFGKGFGTYMTRNEHRLVLSEDCTVDPLCLLLLALHLSTRCHISL